MLAEKLQTRVEIGRIDLGFLNRVIIDDVVVFDQDGDTLLKASRLSAKMAYIPLAQGKISISSAQLFGLKANLYKQKADAKANYQFVLDALSSKDTTKHTPLDLAINSLVIRNGSIKYDQNDIPTTQKLNPRHLSLTNLSCHIMLNRLTDDSLNLYVKKVAFKERSGLWLKSLSFALEADKQHAKVSNLLIELPHSELSMPLASATYRFNGKQIEPASLQYEAEIERLTVNPTDISCLVPILSRFTVPVSAHIALRGTSTSLRISQFEMALSNNGVKIEGDGSVYNWNSTPRWVANVRRLTADATAISGICDRLKPQIELPTVVSRLGDISFLGEIGGLGLDDLSARGTLNTDAGNVKVVAGKSNSHINGRIDTDGIDLQRLSDDSHLGTLAASLYVVGDMRGNHLSHATLQGNVSRFDYNGYTYSNISIDGVSSENVVKGKLGIDDPNAKVDLQGSVDLSQGNHSANIIAQIRHLSPSRLGISDRWADADFDFDVNAALKGASLNDICGDLSLTDFKMNRGDDTYTLQSLNLKAENTATGRILRMDSDFGDAQVDGKYDYANVIQSITNLVKSKLPTLPGLPAQTSATHNNFSINATIDKTDWLQRLMGIPIEIHRPIRLKGYIDDNAKTADIMAEAPLFEYDGKRYEYGYLHIATPNDTLAASAHIRQATSKRHGTYWNVEAKAADNRLHTQLSFENNNKNGFHGQMAAETQFFKDDKGVQTAKITVLPSDITVGDTLWNVKPSQIYYQKDYAFIDNFAIAHNKQHIKVSGKATKSPSDTLTVDLHDVDVSYILNLVNFHSVEFSGNATGYAYLSAVFGKPEASADLLVTNFKFEEGRMGVLSANVVYNTRQEQLDIDAAAYDEDHSQTIIKGYVSPKRNYIDLNINARHTRGEFLESFCGSFMRDINLFADGNVRIFGDLKEINMAGDAIVNGTVGIKSLNTTYTLRNAAIKMIPDEIQIDGDSIFDRNGNYGIVNGKLYHKHLTKLSYDIGIQAHNLLSYDFKDYGDDVFYGTVYATGDCNIKGKSGEVTINAHLTPEKESFIEYNAASPDAINSQSFIHWQDRDSLNMAAADPDMADDDENAANIDIPTDIHMNLLIDCTPQSTLRVLMDKQSGDYIALNGNGTIRASYFNKGDFDMFGTYEVDHGIYKLTIQNVIRRDFQFMQGGNIVFGGNAMDAILNLKAQYAVNGVSLSDLNIGRSFSSNNIRVNCLMNIAGTPRSPRVTFDLDLPTVNSDAKQMVANLINSEEGMNQQVLYLLAVGRFYSQGSNNASQENPQQQSRTSLAMQSILSGTLSQQLSNVLSSVTHNTNWNLGANISTGDEGWNNAEYEGLLSGRLLNNRLLINGQFGYRDNANATTSFIGDFDLRYLIFPNGNLAIRVYNQTNDRYFTRNSLNTQGLGLILKKDFNGWRDLFGIAKNKKTKATKKTKKRAKSAKKGN